MWPKLQRVAAPTMHVGRASLTEHIYRGYVNDFCAEGQFSQGVPENVDIVRQRSSRPAAHAVEVSARACLEMDSITVHVIWTAANPF